MPNISRRHFLQGVAVSAGALLPVLQSQGLERPAQRGPARRILLLDREWLFGGKFDSAALAPGFDDSHFSSVTLPHVVTQLSWRNWDPASWQDQWIYRRHFTTPAEMRGLRLFLHFDRVMAAATPVLNGHALPQYMGGFLPFEYEVTALARAEGNVLAVNLDARWLNAPPSGSPKGSKSIDYLLPGGISGGVSLRAVPAAFIDDVSAKPVNVLHGDRRLDLTCRVNSSDSAPRPALLTAALYDGGRKITEGSAKISTQKGDQDFTLSLRGLENISLWDVDDPHLYDLTVTLYIDGKAVHDYTARTGFREAKFDLDGFFLNGRRMQIFGLDRHELYPYMGFSAPDRAFRTDAKILKREFNCNAVRCSHYPQSEAFLDACDELGMVVWEELPGWQYIGDDSWQKLAQRDVRQMVIRDRNHPSVAIWGVRINESRNDPYLYLRTKKLAKSLDDSRPTSGTMTPSSEKNWREEWHQDVFAFDDYHSAPDGSVGIKPPLPGVPYMIAETVGQYNYGGKGFGRMYRRAGDPAILESQALLHAQAHSKAGDFPRIAGVIAWCAFDYGSLLNAYEAVKYPGVADVFRIPKLGAAVYQAQCDPALRPVIAPSFCWDFGTHTPDGPGEHAAIFSNCDQLDVTIEGKRPVTLHPDRSGFPHLKYPPFFADLRVHGSAHPELRIDGYVSGARVLSRRFSADRSRDSLWLRADDHELEADGSDATRLVFGAVDRFGALRPYADGAVRLEIAGPGTVVGDNPFDLGANGGAGAVWIRTQPGKQGVIRTEAAHAVLGHRSVEIRARNGRGGSHKLG